MIFLVRLRLLKQAVHLTYSQSRVTHEYSVPDRGECLPFPIKYRAIASQETFQLQEVISAKRQ